MVTCVECYLEVKERCEQKLIFRFSRTEILGDFIKSHLNRMFNGLKVNVAYVHRVRENTV